MKNSVGTQTAAIIGGGVIGGGWAARFLLNGWNVRIFDPGPLTQQTIHEVLDNARRSFPALSDNHVSTEGELQFCETMESAVSGVAWVQESVPEQRELKQKVYRQIQEHTANKTIIASSTSGFKPSQLQEGAKYPEAIMVAHPFNPVYLLPLVELVPSKATNTQFIEKAKQILSSLSMHPLHVRKEIDAHIADRLLEAVWREGLWLVKDDIATTQEIDDAIRYGFGLRWAQMGLFETYRIAGGKAGMKHFIAQFGPCLSWPWTKLMDVPELTDELVEKIASQSDTQSGIHTIRELERIRDDNLVAMLRALKARDWGAGALLKKQDQRAKPPLPQDIYKPLTTLKRVIPIDWTDYNGHMNESRYGQVFSDAGDVVMAMVGADQAYIDSGLSYFTVDNHITFQNETKAGEPIYVTTQVLRAEGKRLRMYHEMFRLKDNVLLATCNQLLIHVSLETRRSCEPSPEVSENLNRLHNAQSKLSKPDSLPIQEWDLR